MNQYIFDARPYFLAEDIYRLEPQSFMGCSRTTRLMVQKRNIPENHYTYCAWIKSRQVWEPKKPEYKPAKLFISVEWAREHITSLKESEEKTDQDAAIDAQRAPPILVLEEDQLFKDEEGNVIDIEIRGSRDIEGIYFRVSDIEKGFKLHNASNTIQSGDWIEGDDYKKFFIVDQADNIKRLNNTFNLFFTFSGLIRYLYVSRSKKAKAFQKWANKILFTHQFGSRKEQRAAAASLLGADITAVKEVFRTNARSMPCIYLFAIDEVRALKEKMILPSNAADDDVVYKYGFTENLTRRASEHQRCIGKVLGCELKLKYFSYIDPQFCSKAEIDIKVLFEGLNISFKNDLSNELAIIPKEKLEMVQKIFSNTGATYMGHLSEILLKVKEAEARADAAVADAQIQALKYQNQIQKLEYEARILALELEAARVKLSL